MASAFPAGFDPAQALRYGAFVEQAYRRYYTFKGMAGRPPFEVPEGYRRVWDLWGKERGFPVPFGFAALSPEKVELVVAVRGTEDRVEWEDDIVKSDQIGYDVAGKPTLVHRGFDSLFQSLFWTAPDSASSPLSLDGALPRLDQAGPAPRLVLAGHSLGAPLVTRLGIAFVLAQPSQPPPVIYSYAGPRGGDPAFAALANGLFPTLFRVVNKWDLVPHSPAEDYWDPFTRRTYWYQHFKGEVEVDSGFSVDVPANHYWEAYRRGLAALCGSS